MMKTVAVEIKVREWIVCEFSQALDIEVGMSDVVERCDGEIKQFISSVSESEGWLSLSITKSAGTGAK